MALPKSNKFANILVGSDDPSQAPAPTKVASLHSVPGLAALNNSEAVPSEQPSPGPHRVAGWDEMRAVASKTGGLNPAARGFAQAVEASTAEQAAEIARLKQMAEGGLHIQELDPALIDPSFVRDRMEIDEESVRSLSEQIAADGQLIPILVRPHPSEPGRFQVAYGHRRRLACSMLGRPVRAIVRDLTDDELIVAQGQENNARLNLSYIEKALFAKTLVDRKTPRPVVASALGVSSQSQITWYLKTVTAVTVDLITQIGPAPGIGRRRWEELAEYLKEGSTRIETASALLDDPELAKLDSDERFEELFNRLTQKTVRAPNQQPKLSVGQITLASGASIGSFSTTESHAYLKLDRKVAEGFTEFLLTKMEQLHAEWAANK